MNCKALLFSLLLLCLSIALKAQMYDSVGYYNQMNYLYARLDKTKIGSGFLREYAIEWNNWDNFTGTALHDSSFVTLTEWRLLYAGLYSSKIRSSPAMLYLDTLNRRLNKYSFGNQPVSMAVLFSRYQTIKANAITANLLRLENGQLVDVAGRTESPYYYKQIFAVAPIRQAVYTGTSQIIFRSDLFFGNANNVLSTIEVDATGSGAWQTVALNTPFNVSYATEGFYTFKTRITYTDGTQRMSHTKLAVYAKPDNGTSSIKLRKQSSLSVGNDIKFSLDDYGNNPTPMLPVPMGRQYLGASSTGDITIEFARSNNTGQIRKPLIVVEGFDIDNTYDYDRFANNEIDFDFNFRPEVGITFDNNLDNIGEYDLIFVNWRNATDYIQRNAFLLEAVIQQVNNDKQPFDGVRQQNVIIGLSMGGVVARYALRDMENLGQNHETRLLIAHDSPFKGANIPVGFQVAAQHLGAFKILNVGGNFPFIRYDDLVPEIANLLRAFSSPAAKQLIIQRYMLNSTGSISATNGEYNNFQAELNNLGWPQNCRTVTVSNGSCNGTKVFNNSNANFFSLAGENRGMTYFRALWQSLVLTLGGALSLPPNLIVQSPVMNQPNWFALLWEFPLTTLSTRTTYGINFSCNAIPTTGTAEIYRGRIYSTKRVLGLVSITSNFINLTVNSQSGMIPLDDAPGGVYDMETFGIDPDRIEAQLPEFLNFVNANINQPRFCFVPTVSSTAHNSASSAWFANVCGNVECNTPAQVADAYLQNANQLHISYTQAIGNWLMQRQDAAFACAKVCAPNLVISGNAAVCTNEPFSVNAPAGAIVSWSALPSGIVNLSPIGNSVVINRVGTGSVTLTATITNSCTPGRSVSRPIQAGVGPVVNISYAMSGGCNGATQGWMLNATANNPVTSWRWTVDNPSSGNWYIDNPTSPHTYASVANGGGGISVTATNACGTTKTGVTIWSNCGSGFTVSPNPADDEATVTVTEEETQTANAVNKPKGKLYQINVSDISGNVRRQFRYSSGITSVRISLAGLPEGVYTIQGFNGKVWRSVQLIKR